MLDRLASGGLITVIVILLMALGYARVLDAPRQVYIGIAVTLFMTIIGSQFLPEGNIFRLRIADSFGLFGRILLWVSPVIAYALLIGWIRRKAKDPEGK